jgi:hypothetical protein
LYRIYPTIFKPVKKLLFHIINFEKEHKYRPCKPTKPTTRSKASLKTLTSSINQNTTFCNHHLDFLTPVNLLKSINLTSNHSIKKTYSNSHATMTRPYTLLKYQNCQSLTNKRSLMKTSTTPSVWATRAPAFTPWRKKIPAVLVDYQTAPIQQIYNNKIHYNTNQLPPIS